MKKIVAILLLLVCLVFLNSCKKEATLTGSWVRLHGAGYGSVGEWPDIMILNKDGTGSGDGLPLNWTVTDNVFRFTNFMYKKTRYYKLTGDTLCIYGDEDCTDLDLTYKRN